MIIILWACGHTARHDGTGVAVCPTCGETRVARVVAPPPRITGWAEGPYVTENRHLSPAVVQLATEPLALKKET